MKNECRFKVLVISTLLALFYIGCYSDQFEPVPIVIDPVDTISFKEEIIPRLIAGCAQSICHGAGANVPELTSSTAYNSLINGGFVNTTDPVKSDLYLWLIGDGGRDIMPPSGKDDKLIELILGWMKQGALNN